MTGPPSGAHVPGNRWDLAPGLDDRREPVSVSVVVTHYEQPAQLARTLAALASQQPAPERLQVVVADDGSREPPATGPGVEVVRQADAGFRAARVRNLAAARATGDVLLFLDADTTPEPGYVAAMSRLPGALPEAVVVGRRRHADLTGLEPGGAVRAHGEAHELTEPAWLRDAYRRTGDLLEADETSFRFVVGAVLGCSRWFFEETGGFDESFTGYGGEDWEWGHRAWTHGAVLAHVPAAVAWHDGPDRGERPGWQTGGDDGTARRRLLQETVALARRVPVPGVAPAALLGATGDPVVTLADDLAGDGLVLTLDALLAAWPRARVLLDAARCASLPEDPRLLPHHGALLQAAAARSAWRHLHVERAVTGGAAAWTDGGALLSGSRGAEEVVVLAADGEVALRWATLRGVRRATRWPQDPPVEPTTVLAGLEPVASDLTAQARWGGWA